MSFLALFIEALTLQAGYNAALVAIGATLLAAAAGGAGAFIFLRKRALVSDAAAHATLPGIGLAFLLMTSFGGDGRNLVGLLAGSALSAWAGLLCIEWLARRTRLTEDAAIGAILSVFFGAGVVLLTVIQNWPVGRQAGLESFLLGSTAGMLFADALTIAVGGALTAAAVYVLRRPMTIAAFDPEFAVATGLDLKRVDLAMMGLALAVVVIGLKVVGLVLIVALLIIPAVAARFWTDRSDRLAWIAALIGAGSAYVGAALSASAPDLPTGPVIVLICFAVCMISLLIAPGRGLVSSLIARRRLSRRVHLRQGLLALGRGEPIFDSLTLTVLRRAGLIRPDGVATEAGKAQAARALWDERRWREARRIHQGEGVSLGRFDGLTPIEEVLTADEIGAIDAAIGGAGLMDGEKA